MKTLAEHSGVPQHANSMAREQHEGEGKGDDSTSEQLDPIDITIGLGEDRTGCSQAAGSAACCVGRAVHRAEGPLALLTASTAAAAACSAPATPTCSSGWRCWGESLVAAVVRWARMGEEAELCIASQFSSVQCSAVQAHRRECRGLRGTRQAESYITLLWLSAATAAVTSAHRTCSLRLATLQPLLRMHVFPVIDCPVMIGSSHLEVVRQPHARPASFARHRRQPQHQHHIRFASSSIIVWVAAALGTAALIKPVQAHSCPSTTRHVTWQRLCGHA